ncbi:MAG: hypothetical protein IJ437_01355 [Clostridia bacterium]|nr:hypothetical protein [Clostridia bacterium]
MKYSYKDKPLKVFGVPNIEKTGVFERLPAEIREKIPSLEFLGRRTPGARLCFRTDAPSFTVKIELETLSVDIGLSIFTCQSANVYLGERQNSKFLGLVNPPNYETKEFSKTFYKKDGMDEITIWLPRNEIISNVEIEIPGGYKVEEPTPYKYSLPALYYGSSITEEASAANQCASYNALISRHLDLDYYNFGFSGNCKGEPEMADYINTLDFSVLIYDYDHNAPTVEHLKETHEKFFNRIREKKPNVPVIMITRPTATFDDDAKARRDIVKKTYENALKKGDKHVYFIDGEKFFKDFPDKEVCFTDTTHPTDLGFYKMAEKIEPVIERALTEKE